MNINKYEYHNNQYGNESSILGSNDLKSCLETVVEVSDFIKTSLGPKSGDKLIVDENGNLIVTNDGYSIIKYLSKSSKFDDDNNNNNNNNEIVINNKQTQQQPHHQQLQEDHHESLFFSKSSTIERKRFQSIIELLIDCCKTQERLYGDGTTSVLVLVGSFCLSAIKLIFEKGIPPHLVSIGFQQSLKQAIKLLDNNNYYLNVNINNNNNDDNKQQQRQQQQQQANNNNNNNNNNNIISINQITQSSLLSKSVSFYKEKLSRISIDAVKLIYSYYKRVELKRIKIITIEGSSIENCRLIKGCLIKRFFSHENMPKIINDANIIVLSCKLEFPKPKTNFNVTISSRQEYNKIIEIKNQYYQSIKDKIELLVKSFNLNCIVCQWGIDQEINEYLNQIGISAISWVPGDDLERIANSSGANIINDLDSITIDTTTITSSGIDNKEFIGNVKEIKEIVMGNDSSIRYIEFSECKFSSTITILVRGGSKEMCDETSQCLRDSIHIVGGCLKDPRVVPSGGSTELYLYNNFQKQQQQQTVNDSNNNNNNKQSSLINMVIKSWSDSLLTIPITLLENGGYDCQDLIIKLIQIHNDDDDHSSDNNKDHDSKYYGININNSNKEFDLYSSNNSSDYDNYKDSQVIQNMKFKSWELLNLKKSILKLATETTCMILSIDAFISL